MAEKAGSRSGNRAWKHVYGTDRKYTRRVDAVRERGQYTEPGTPGNGPKKERKK